MACRLASAKPLSAYLHQCWNIVTWTLGNKLLWNLNTLRPRQNGRHYADDTFKCIFLKENVRISIKISLNFVPKSPIDNIPALFKIMAWRRPGDKPLSVAMMVSLLTHICVARLQWVNRNLNIFVKENAFENVVWKMAAILDQPQWVKPC